MRILSIYRVERFEMNSGEEVKRGGIAPGYLYKQTDRQTIKSNLFTSRCSKTTVPSAEEETTRVEERKGVLVLAGWLAGSAPGPFLLLKSPNYQHQVARHVDDTKTKAKETNKHNAVIKNRNR